MISVFQFTKEFDKDFNYRCIYNIEKILEQEKCCSNFPNCVHPKYQTKLDLFDRNLNVITIENICKPKFSNTIIDCEKVGDNYYCFDIIFI